MSDPTPTTLGQVGAQLIAHGYAPVPIAPGKKKPAASAWQHMQMTPADVLTYAAYGAGILCGQGPTPIVGIDIDVSVPELAARINELCEKRLGPSPQRVGAAPRQMRVYRASEAGWRKAQSDAFLDPADPAKAQRVEVLGVGQQFVAYHVHPDTGKPYEWIGPWGSPDGLPAPLLTAVTREQVDSLLQEVSRLIGEYPGVQVVSWGSPVGERVEVEEHALATLEPTLGISEAEMADWLNKINPSQLEYEKWLGVGAGTHHETHGSEAGFALWLNWSKASSKFTTEAYSRARWASMGRYGSKPITFASVIHLAREHMARRTHNARVEIVAAVKACSDTFQLERDIARDVRLNPELDAAARDVLANAMLARFKELGTPFSIAAVRRMITPPKEARDALVEWHEGYVFVTEHDKFYHCGRGEWLTQTGFNAKFNRHMPRADGAARNVLKNASAYVLEDAKLKTVARAMYLPWANADGDGTFEHDGQIFVNTYRPASAPLAAPAILPAGEHAIGLLRQHLGLIAGGRQEIARVLLAWIAHNVQRPGMKIRWAPVIKGIEGDGKTVLGILLAVVMGYPNIKQVSPKVLGTDFSDWAHGACVGVLEELKLTGHNRHDILNALKPYITNDVIAVHPKGKAEVTVINTMNYLAFTNHADALPLSDTDRRWYVVFTPHRSRADLDAALLTLNANGTQAYFDELFAGLHEHAGQLRRWLLDPVHLEGFSPNSVAPMTPEKLTMMSLASSADEEVIREIIASGAEGVARNVLSSPALLRACRSDERTEGITSAVVRNVLPRLGWTPVRQPTKVRWERGVDTVWVCNFSRIEHNALAAALNDTIAPAARVAAVASLFPADEATATA